MVALALKQPALFEMNADPEPTAPSVHRTPGHTQSQSIIHAGEQRYQVAAPPASVHSAGHSATARDAGRVPGAMSSAHLPRVANEPQRR